MPINSLTQGESLKGWQYKAVRMQGGSNDFKVIKVDASGDQATAIGVLLDDPDTTTAGVSVSHPGDLPCRALLGGTVNAGSWLVSDAEGKLIAFVRGTTPDRAYPIIGLALENGVADDIILIAPMLAFSEIDG